MMQEQGYAQQEPRINPRVHNMDGVLERELEEGEELLWFGQPSTQSRNRPAPARVFAILGGIFGSIGAILLTFGILFLTAFGLFNAGLSLTITGGIFLLMGLIYTIVAITLRLRLKNTIYAITNQRIIVLTTGLNTIVDSYSKKDIGPITRIEHADGVGDIFFTANRGGYNYNYNYNYNGTNINSSSASSSNWNGNNNKWQLLGVIGVREVEHLIRRTFLQER